jgi:amidase
MAELAFRSATDLAAALRRREIGSRELLDVYLDRVERLDRRLNAVVTLDAERARDEAAAADEAAARGEPLGPLHGLPITIKDSIETAGLRTTCGAPELAGYVPERDAVAVARLRAAGAIVFGKTNVPTWAGEAQTYNPVFGTTNNPWDGARSPGGSSGGPAAAVAAGLSALDLGSDLGGSIRMPAGYCGVFGLRPSGGVVPMRGHVPPPSGTLVEIDMAVLGPIARSAPDLATVLDVIAGPDAAAGTAWQLRLPPPRAAALRDYRIAGWIDDPDRPVDREVGDVLAGFLDALRAEGVKVDEDVRPAPLRDSALLFQRLAQAAMSSAVPEQEFDRLCEVAASAEDSPHTRWARHVTQRARDWNLAHQQRLELAARWAELFRDYDVVVCPVTPTAAIRHDQSPDVDARTIEVNGTPTPYWEQVRWVTAISATYLPVAVVPVGRTAAGLPVGAQLVGPFLEDRTVLDAAARVADLLGGFQPPPGF